MYNELTKNDIKKMEEEIEYRKLVVRKEAIEAVKEAKTSSIMQPKRIKTKMRAGSGTWNG